jgi:hypothetical protein
VSLLSGQKKNTKTRDQYVFLPELRRNKLTVAMPSPNAGSRVVPLHAFRANTRRFPRLLSAAPVGGGGE